MAKTEAIVSKRYVRRLVREGELVAEVEVELLDTDGGWSPYLSLDDAYKLDEVREALESGNLQRASRLANKLYRLSPIQS